MSRPVRPSRPPGPLLPVVIFSALWGAIALGWLIWICGRIAGLMTGKPWDNGPGFGPGFARGLLRGQWVILWPGVSMPAVVGVAVVIFGLVVCAAVMIWRFTARFRVHPHDPLRSMARAKDVEALTPAAVARVARRLRPRLTHTPTTPTPAQCGLPLGRLKPAGPKLRADWEQTVLMIMPPRGGKTTSVAIPAIVEAPGPAVATSNKADLYAATTAARGLRGHVWVFDPQRIAYAEQDWWWNPLADLDSAETAVRLASHFTQEIEGEHDDNDFWVKAASEVLAGLFLAAALETRCILDVYDWLCETTSTEPVEILANHGYRAMSHAIKARQQGAFQTREGIYENARTAAQCLRDPAITRWVTPGHADREFRASAFVTSTDTLYLMSKLGAGAGPLVAALTDRVIHEGVRCAEAQGGRLDPPLELVLDEAANICRIRDLPDLYSHVGSRGIVAVTILQSYKQGERAWGKSGMSALWSAATIKLVGAGIDDPQTAEDISKLIGEHDIAVTSLSRSQWGEVSESTSLRRQRILPPDQVRALPKGTALVMATGCKIAMIELTPWYESDTAAGISAAHEAVIHTITQRAHTDWHTATPPNN